MTCTFSRELVALYIEGDLSESQVEKVNRHLTQCVECERFCHQLEESQTQFKSLLRRMPADTVGAAALANVRRSVMSRIENSPARIGWMVRLERAALLAGIAVVVVLSASMLVQIQASRAAAAAAVFEGKDTLRIPDGYRQWIFVGSSKGLRYGAAAEAGDTDAFNNVYIDPSAYRKYAETGKFPEGTVMVLETANAETEKTSSLQGSYEKQLAGLEVSVKDSRRFEGGWGYFRFTGANGKTITKTAAIPNSGGCLACHRDRAETDHVFTQFYPVLRSAIAKS